MKHPAGLAAGLAVFAVNRVRRVLRGGRFPLTMGVRILVRNADDEVLLVKHTYVKGWHFPGGAIDPRETAVDAAVRELREETLMTVDDAPRLMGVYLSLTEKKSDHIVVFACDGCRPIEGRPRVAEIAEAKFFPLQALPEGTTGGTRRRVQELLGEREVSAVW